MTDYREKGIDKEILDKVEQRAIELENKHHGCAQCTLLAIQDVCNLKSDTLTKASSALAGGIGRMRSACGALSGAALAIGVKYGRGLEDMQGSSEDSIEKLHAGNEVVEKLARWFEREFGSVECRDIRRAYLGTELNPAIPWQKQWISDLKLSEHCTKVVAKTARRAAALLQNPDLSIVDEV
ncbi:C-GCAxxG-C-C family protein [Chloroflexota bacterium]